MNKSLKITDLPCNERPREKIIRYGAGELSNNELLAIVLRCGTKSENIINLCNRLLKKSGGLNGLFDLTSEEFMEIKGIGAAKAAQLLAIAELSKRFKSFKSGDEMKIKCPKDAADLLMEDMRYLKEEHLKVILLNTKNIVIYIKDVSIGSINSSIVHPREVFVEAIKRRSATILICHNHPSGDPTPSEEDISITRRLLKCSNIVGIDILDHLIIGNGKYISLKEKGML
ncbi:DNA repair protein RadC [Clostridium sediminicola]|uniref:RadC family protein n=1 Tax=Clostridium sediminicola TaxID=3114879 RepID=UPI0031F22411